MGCVRRAREQGWRVTTMEPDIDGVVENGCGENKVAN